ncbi:MAG: hypothetical protein MI919_13210 [Holophagales bacterium]|nr:hypothetical protein [Holophagales bacterium]
MKRCWPAVPVLLLIGAVAGVAMGLTFGSRSYRAETVLLFRRAADSAGEIGTSTYLETQLHTIKLPENLVDLRDRLEIAATLEGLGAATGAFIRQGTGLLVIDARWKSAAEAASIANTLREIFWSSHLEMMAAEKAIELETAVKAARKELREVETQLERLHELEMGTRNRISEDRRSRPEEEGLGDLNIRVERLRDAIIDDQKQRWNEAELEKRNLDLGSAGRLVGEGLVPLSELDRLAAEVAKQEALTLDTEQTGEWKDELERLLAVALPSESATSPSAPVLQEMLLKDFYLRLDNIRLRFEIDRLESRLSEIEELLTEIRSGQVPSSSIARELGRFQVISEARPPVWPERSSRRLIAFGVLMLVSGGGLVMLLARELADTRIKSGAELQYLLDRPVIASLESGSPSPREPVCWVASLLDGTSSVHLFPVEVEDPDAPRRFAERVAEELRERGRTVAVIDGDRPLEELVSTTFHDLVAEADASHDLVLILGPPAGPVSDRRAELLARQAEDAIVWTSARHARCGRIRRAMESLEHGPTLMGVVLDNVDPAFTAL